MTPLSFAWQLPQIALGAVVSAAPIISSKAVFEDKKICFWHSNMGMSLGHYIFLPEQLSEIPVDDLPAQAIFRHAYHPVVHFGAGLSHCRRLALCHLGTYSTAEENEGIEEYLLL